MQKAGQLPQEEKSDKKDVPAAEPQADEAIKPSQDDELKSAAPTRSS
jgi:hypothetical protein